MSEHEHSFNGVRCRICHQKPHQVIVDLEGQLAEARKRAEKQVEVVKSAEILIRNAGGHPDSCCAKCDEAITQAERRAELAEATVALLVERIGPHDENCAANLDRRPEARLECDCGRDDLLAGIDNTAAEKLLRVVRAAIALEERRERIYRDSRCQWISEHGDEGREYADALAAYREATQG